jgi:HK97 family phage prohead protease
MAVPTDAMAREAQRGLDWRQEYGRGGTEVGVARARDIVNKRDLSDDTIGRMVSYFARHEVDKEGQGFSPGEEGYPSAGRIAWALWGGDPGQSWANRQWDRIQAEKEKGKAMNIYRKTLALNNVELKFKKSGGGSFVGYASTFGGIDSYRDTIMRGAYSDFLAEMESGKQRMPKMFINHRSWMIPPGKYTDLMEDDKGLMVEGELTPGNAEAGQVKAAMEHGTIDGLSIGFQLEDDDYEMVEDDAGQMMRVIKRIKSLPEISIVTYPADDDARIDLSSVKSALESLHTIRDLEEFLRDAGMSRSLATATASRAKKLFSQGEPAQELKNKKPDDLMSLIRATNLLAKTL